MKLFGNFRRPGAEKNAEPETAGSTPLPEEEELPVTAEDILKEYRQQQELQELIGDDLGDSQEETPEERQKRISLTKKVLIVGLCLLAVTLVGAGLFVNYLLGLINYQRADSDYFATVSTAEDLPEETPETDYLAALEAEEMASSMEATEEELLQWDQQIRDVISDGSTYEVPISEDVYNILLIGSDTRTSGTVGRSDAMILISINQKTETIYLTSFLRDCYVHIPGYGNTRLNHAFAYGGPALLMETLEENFKVHVDKYVAVDFFSFMDAIDIVGGVYINVPEDELKVANDYIWSMNKLLGEDWYNDYIWNSGWQLLNGKQALCYARNRYVGNDYERTQRQRTIINQLIEGAKQASPATLVDLAQVILPQITTDMERSQIVNYAANVGAYMNYDIVQQQIPAAGTYYGATISGMSVISLDLDDNITYLQSTIYEGTPYGVEMPEELAANLNQYEITDSDSATGVTMGAIIGTRLAGLIAEQDYYGTESETAAAATPKPSASPSPSPSATPKPSASPSPSPSATPKPSASPSPSPSASPAIAPPAASNGTDEGG